MYQTLILYNCTVSLSCTVTVFGAFSQYQFSVRLYSIGFFYKKCINYLCSVHLYSICFLYIGTASLLCTFRLYVVSLTYLLYLYTCTPVHLYTYIYILTACLYLDPLYCNLSVNAKMFLFKEPGNQ